jgi:hypothetical protein
MQYNRDMMEIVYTIRNRLDAQARSSIKPSNPEMLEDLAEIYRTCGDEVLTGLIEDLMTLAGSTWLALLKKAETNPPTKSLGKTPRASVEQSPLLTRLAAPNLGQGLGITA